MERERIVQLFFFGFLAAMAYELYRLLEPLLVPIIWAMLLAFVFHPLMVHAGRLTRHRSLAALTITLVAALGVILPALWLLSLLANEAGSLYAAVSDLVRAGGGLIPLKNRALQSRLAIGLDMTLGRFGLHLGDEITRLVLETAKTVSNLLLADAAAIAKNLVSFLIDFGVILVSLFYLLRDGESYYEALRDLTPLHEEDKRAVFDSLTASLSAVMRGLLLTALLQGLVLGLGFLVLGVPYWTFLAIASAACGLLPFGGTAVVWLPASLYLFHVHGWGRALAMVAWGSVSVAVIDNFIKPAAIGQGTGLPALALFFAITGGLLAYGALGLFAGPAVIAVFAALVRAYRKSYGTVHREAA